ncbi:DNA-binding NarL/FixJ family response regulator [Microbacteriaceae bacterium SG_E_30_P1]|uniref:DNA-binding NarL/FixJ family response regulator n=2 Tax=Antiquaquibacter oligotrophicus TaxID=2880260 RepID=A0ABT6KN63_9MICO|nr:DNA-binding NarL/FixJ family response regulator [Antiquaquibacter oligotrophicus]
MERMSADRVATLGSARWAAPVIAAAAVGFAALSLLLPSSTRGFPGHPLAVGALTVAAIAVAVIARRAPSRGARRSLLATSLSLALYLALGLLVLAPSSSVSAPVAARVWSVLWIAPIVLPQLAALSAGQAPRRWLLIPGIASVAAAIVAVAVIRPDVETVATAADLDSPLIADITSSLALAALLVAPIWFAVHLGRAPRDGRPRMLVLTVASIIPVIVVAFCLGLSVFRGQGGVDPTNGSVAFVVVLALGALSSAFATATAAEVGAHNARRIAVATVIVALIVAIVVAGTALVASSLRHGTTLSAVLVAAVTIASMAIVFAASRAIARMLAPPPVADRLGSLSARETEVLSKVAAGLGNADIAASLHLSERTVESHVRNLYTKLGLAADDNTNRRVAATRMWHESGF